MPHVETTYAALAEWLLQLAESDSVIETKSTGKGWYARYLHYGFAGSWRGPFLQELTAKVEVAKDVVSSDVSQAQELRSQDPSV
jgi:hypothetical protein